MTKPKKPGIIKHRLALRRRKEGAAIIDRWLNFVIEEVVDPDTVEGLRGPVFMVDDDWEALELFRKLKRMAKDARKQGMEVEFLDALDRNLGTGETTAQDDPCPTFEVFTGEWEQIQLDGSCLSERDIESAKSIIKLHLVPFFGRLPLSEIRARQIDAYKAAKRRQRHQYGVGYGGKSINNHLSVLSRILDVARDYELIDTNPVKSGRHWQRREQTPEDSRNWLEQADEQKVIGWLSNNWSGRPVKRLAVLTQLVAGLRFSELRALSVEDLVEVPQPGIFIRRKLAGRKTEAPKNKRARFQPLPRELFVQLKALAAESKTGVLFTPPKGRHLANNTTNRWLTDACEQAGVRRVTTHGLRHTAGSSYGALGYGQKEIADLLGHSEVRSAARYVHASDKRKGRAVDERWAQVASLDEARQKAQADGEDH